jgi:hypothetical protein
MEGESGRKGREKSMRKRSRVCMGEVEGEREE